MSMDNCDTTRIPVYQRYGTAIYDDEIAYTEAQLKRFCDFLAEIKRIG